MKNLILLLLFMPAFAAAQFGFKNCQVDLLIGYDYGDRIGFNKEKYSNQTHSSLRSIRLGTNMAFPISKKWLVISGLRFVSQLSFDETEYTGLGVNFINEIVAIRKRHFNDLFVEVPFMVRRSLKQNSKGNNFFIEGGLQFNIYTTSYWKEKFMNLTFPFREDISRYFISDSFRGVSINQNFSIGREILMKNEMTFFIQAVGRFELLTANFDNKNAFHFGIETGLRF